MKKVIILIILLFAAFLSNAQNLLNSPQKIVIDTERNRYLVSNFDGGGDLIQIDSLGIQDTFIVNAGMVDGMQIIGDTVYGSAFGGRVIGYDLDSGIQVMNLNLSSAGVQFLSGFVADSAGFLYTSERFGNRIFKIDVKTQTYWVFAIGSGIDQPNGMLYEKTKNRILVCLDKPNPPILAISILDSSVTTVATTTLGGSDGIAKDANGNYYITGYYLHGMYKFDPDFTGSPSMFYKEDYMVYPTYNEKNNSLLVTLYEQNDWLEIPLGSSSVSTGEIQKDFTLNNNYPNPFNPSTTIAYSLREKGYVKLMVYDLMGEKVATLVNEEQPAGYYEVEFHGQNSGLSTGNSEIPPLASGIYLYRIEIIGEGNISHYSDVKKMILLK